MNKINIRAAYDFTSNKIKLMARMESKICNMVRLADDITFLEVKEGTITPSFVELSMEEAQELLDSLINSGVEPTKKIFTHSSHLEDMRRLVSKAYGVEL